MNTLKLPNRSLNNSNRQTLQTCIPVKHRLDSHEAMNTHVQSCMLTYAHVYLLMYTHVFSCILMYSYVHCTLQVCSAIGGLIIIAGRFAYFLGYATGGR